MHDKSEKHQLVGYGTYFLTWFALLALTALTVTVAGMRLGGLSVLGAIVIASVKATIVLLIFMHLRYETRVFRIMVVIVVLTLAVFIGLLLAADLRLPDRDQISRGNAALLRGKQVHCKAASSVNLCPIQQLDIIEAQLHRHREGQRCLSR